VLFTNLKTVLKTSFYFSYRFKLQFQKKKQFNLEHSKFNFETYLDKIHKKNKATKSSSPDPIAKFRN
jgi:hypothetical protein